MRLKHRDNLYPIREYSQLKLIPLKFVRKVDNTEIQEEITGNPEEVSGNFTGRRELLKGLAALPFFGGMLIGTVSRAKSMDTDALSGAPLDHTCCITPQC